MCVRVVFMLLNLLLLVGQQVMGFKEGFWFDAIIKKVCSDKRVVGMFDANCCSC